MQTSWEGIVGEQGCGLRRGRGASSLTKALWLPANLAVLGVVLSSARLGCSPGDRSTGRSERAGRGGGQGGPESSGKASQRG